MLKSKTKLRKKEPRWCGVLDFVLVFYQGSEETFAVSSKTVKIMSTGIIFAQLLKL